MNQIIHHNLGVAELVDLALKRGEVCRLPPEHCG